MCLSFLVLLFRVPHARLVSVGFFWRRLDAALVGAGVDDAAGSRAYARTPNVCLSGQILFLAASNMISSNNGLAAAQRKDFYDELYAGTHGRLDGRRDVDLDVDRHSGRRPTSGLD